MWHGPYPPPDQGPREPDPLFGMLVDENWCRPTIEIAYDMWARTRITCDHGTFEAVSDFLNLTQSYRRACKAFNLYEHTPKCYAECDPPKEWTVGDDSDAEFWRNNTTECDLFKGHEGPCRALEDEEMEARRKVVRR